MSKFIPLNSRRVSDIVDQIVKLAQGITGLYEYGARQSEIDEEEAKIEVLRRELQGLCS